MLNCLELNQMKLLRNPNPMKNYTSTFDHITASDFSSVTSNTPYYNQKQMIRLHSEMIQRINNTDR